MNSLRTIIAIVPLSRNRKNRTIIPYGNREQFLLLTCTMLGYVGMKPYKGHENRILKELSYYGFLIF